MGHGDTVEAHGQRALAAIQPNHTGTTMARGEGSWVWDPEGRKYLDLVSGIATLNLGHGRPEVLAAAQAQMHTLAHGGGAFLDQPVYAFAERLAGITPDGIDSILFSATGSGANESALHMARVATGRDDIVSFRGSFHGRTEAALAASVSRAEFRTKILATDVTVAPFPHVEAPGEEPDDLADRALAELDEIHETECLPEEVAAYVVEPVQGLGGCFPAGERFLSGLRERADRYGILLLFDEVQTGMGRTGAWFAAERYGVTPDALTSAKALGSGFPISALATRHELVESLQKSGHGSTFAASPVACAAGQAAIDVVEREGILERVWASGEVVLARLDAIASEHESLRRARGLGYMLALACRDREAAVAIAEGCIDRGVLVTHSGMHADTVRLIPPLTISDEELDFGLGVVEEAAAAADAAP